jgi:hypothetical protein
MLNNINCWYLNRGRCSQLDRAIFNDNRPMIDICINSNCSPRALAYTLKMGNSDIASQLINRIDPHDPFNLLKLLVGKNDIESVKVLLKCEILNPYSYIHANEFRIIDRHRLYYNQCLLNKTLRIAESNKDMYLLLSEKYKRFITDDEIKFLDHIPRSIIVSRIAKFTIPVVGCGLIIYSIPLMLCIISLHRWIDS